MKNIFAFLAIIAIIGCLFGANYTLSDQTNNVRWANNNSLIESGNFTVLIFNDSACTNISTNTPYNQSFMGYNLSNGSHSVMLGEDKPLVLLVGNTYYLDYIVNTTDSAGGLVINDYTFRQNNGNYVNCKAFSAAVGIGWFDNDSRYTFLVHERPQWVKLPDNLTVNGTFDVKGMQPCYENGTNCETATANSTKANLTSMNNATIVHKNSTNGIENATINASNITNPQWGLALDCGAGNAIQASVITGVGTCVAVGGAGGEPSWDANASNVSTQLRNHATNITDIINAQKSINNTIDVNFTNISTWNRNQDVNISACFTSLDEGYQNWTSLKNTVETNNTNISKQLSTAVHKNSTNGIENATIDAKNITGTFQSITTININSTNTNSTNNITISTNTTTGAFNSSCSGIWRGDGTTIRFLICD